MVSSFQHQVPEARRYAKIYVRKVMVNYVVRTESPIPAKLKLKAVQYMVKDAVDNKS